VAKGFRKPATPSESQDEDSEHEPDYQLSDEERSYIVSMADDFMGNLLILALRAASNDAELARGALGQWIAGSAEDQIPLRCWHSFRLFNSARAVSRWSKDVSLLILKSDALMADKFEEAELESVSSISVTCSNIF
jgi:hypothetical protein